MRRFAIFVAVFLVIVALGSQSRRAGATDKSICVCIPSRAGLLLKSALVKTQARSKAALASTASLVQ